MYLSAYVVLHVDSLVQNCMQVDLTLQPGVAACT